MAIPPYRDGVISCGWRGSPCRSTYCTSLKNTACPRWASTTRVPLSIWVLYATAIRGPYSGKVVGVSFAAGAVTHAFLFIGYGLFKGGVIGNAGLLVYASVIGFTPIILAVIASRFIKPELQRPVSGLQAA